MKNFIFVLISLFIVSCSPKVFETADGRMVTEKRYDRIMERADRRLSNPKYVDRRIKSLYKQVNRDTKMTQEQKEFFNSISGIDIQVVYDSTDINN